MSLLKAKDVLASVRAALDFPSPENLKDFTLLLKLQEKADYYFTRLNLEERTWFVGSFDLIAVPSRELYDVTADDFGRPITCETVDTSDPYNHIRREIPIGDLQDYNIFYNGTVRAGSGTTTSTDKFSAQFMAFYRTTSNELKLRVVPMPSTAATYRFWYEPNRPTPARLNSSLTFLEQFKNLLVADTALACLPYCRFEPEFSSVLSGSLMRDMQMYLRAFDEFISQSTQQQAGPKPIWNGYGDDWGSWF